METQAIVAPIKKSTTWIWCSLLGGILVCLGGVWAYTQYQDNKTLVVTGNHQATQSARVSKPQFLNLNKFIVSIPGEGRLHYLMMEMSLMSYQPEQMELVNEFLPIIRNAVITKLSEKGYQELAQTSVIPELQVVLRDEIRRVMSEMTGAHGIEQALITKWVIQ